MRLSIVNCQLEREKVQLEVPRRMNVQLEISTCKSISGSTLSLFSSSSLFAVCPSENFFFSPFPLFSILSPFSHFSNNPNKPTNPYIDRHQTKMEHVEKLKDLNRENLQYDKSNSIAIIIGLAFMVLFRFIGYLATKPPKVSAVGKQGFCLVVLGDIGHSPRMLLHARSALAAGYKVDVIGYKGKLGS